MKHNVSMKKKKTNVRVQKEILRRDEWVIIAFNEKTQN